VEVLEPPNFEFEMGAACQGTPLVATGQTGSTMLLHDYNDPNTPENDAANTVIVTQEQRMRVTYGMDNTAWNTFLAKLAELAQHASIRADIISPASTIYDNWDIHRCSIEAVNSVATQIKAVLESPSWAAAENVVIAGSDNIVPFRRVADDTVIGNEQAYLLDVMQEPGSPLFASIAQGYILSDDYYVDTIANAWQGGELYIPDRAIGRLVETPLEITAAAQAFLDSDGVLNPSTGFVAGYDFFQDGADVIGENLDAGLTGTVDSMINETWTAADLRCRLLDVGTDPACATRDVSAPNAHFTHYAALSANGFGIDDFSDFLGSSEVAAAGGGVPILTGDVVFSMGCHAGFNAPDETSEPPDASTGIDPALDFAQAMARQRAVYVASTGFGLGDDEGIGGTEKLLGIFAKTLLDGGTVGDSLVDAKEEYLIKLNKMTVYDVKSSIQSTLYGLPMYEVAPATTMTLQAMAVEEEIVGNVSLTTVDAAATNPTVTTSHVLRSATTSAPANGTYYTVDHESEATAGRPIQPKIAFSPEDRHTYSGAPPPVQGVLLRDATWTDTANDPVFARPTLEWETVAGEYQECLDAFAPADFVQLNSLETADGLLQTVAVLMGQFRCLDAGPPVTGTERLYDSMTLELLRCPTVSTTPPSINDLQIRDIGDGSLLASVDVSDPAGIRRIVILRVSGGDITSTELVLEGAPTSGIFDLELSGSTADDFVVQAENVNCAVGTDTGKAAGRSFISVDGGPDQAVRPLGTATLTATVQDFATLSEPVWFVWEFNDGGFVDGVLAPEELRTLPVTMNPDGSASFTVQHRFTTPQVDLYSATVEIHDSRGGIGVDDVAFECLPSVQDTDCDLVFNTEEPPCDADPNDMDIRPERLDGIFQGVDDDGDSLIDEPLPSEFTNLDCDGDGYTGTVENHVYSYLGQVNGDQKTCGEYDGAFPDAGQTATPSKRWPSDFVSGGNSTNRITAADIGSFTAPIKYLGTNVGTAPGDGRWDVVPGKGTFATDINIQDLGALLNGRTGNPPMLDGSRALDGLACPWPP
jgi:hypothetical protein